MLDRQDVCPKDGTNDNDDNISFILYICHVVTCHARNQLTPFLLSFHPQDAQRRVLVNRLAHSPMEKVRICPLIRWSWLSWKANFCQVSAELKSDKNVRKALGTYAVF
jgi:hypothetical protein